MKRVIKFSVILLVLAAGTVWGQEERKTDAEIRQILINESIARYSGSCPCPYSRDRAGRRCGGRRAYSRPGGASPLCYPRDVSDEMVEAYRKRSEQTQLQEEESVSYDAVIYFYRMKSFTDSSLNPTLYTRGRPLVKLEKNRFFALPVPAGTHYFSWSDQPKEGQEAWVTVGPGQMGFFKVRWREIKPVSETSATRDMRDLEAVEVKNIFDPSVERTTPGEMRVALQARLIIQSMEKGETEVDLEPVRQNPAFPRPTAGSEDPPLTLDELLALLEADIAEEIILAKIALSGCQCDTSASAIITLKGAGASDEMIRQIIVARTEAPRPSPAAVVDTLKDSPSVPELPTAKATPDGRLRWSAESPGMDSIMRDGMLRLIMRAPDGLEVGASIRKYNWDWLNKNHAVILSIENRADNRVTIEPLAVELIELPKNKLVDQVSVQRLVNIHGSAPSASWSELFGLNQSAGALEAQSTAQFLTTTALSANTLSPGEERSGIVWFKQDGDKLLVLVPLGRWVFEFPFHYED